MSAPTSVSAMRLMPGPEARPSAPSICCSAMLNPNTVLTQSESPAREPLAREGRPRPRRRARASPAPRSARSGGWRTRASRVVKRHRCAEATRPSTPPPPPFRRHRPRAGSGTGRAQPDARASRAVEAERIGARPFRAGPGDRKRRESAPVPLHSNTRGRPFVHDRPDRSGGAARRVGAAEQPARRRGHPGAIALLAGPAAERPAPEPVHGDRDRPHPTLVPAERGGARRASPAELRRQRDPVAGVRRRSGPDPMAGGKESTG